MFYHVTYVILMIQKHNILAEYLNMLSYEINPVLVK